VGPRTSLEGFGEEKKNLLHLLGLEFWTVQPVAIPTRLFGLNIYVFSFDIKMCIVPDGVSNFKHSVLFLETSFCLSRWLNVTLLAPPPPHVRLTFRLGQVCMNLTLLSGR